MNDVDRSQWIDNDEGLYLAWRRSRLSKRLWIQKNQRLIDETVENITDNIQPAHYLVYPGKDHGRW